MQACVFCGNTSATVKINKEHVFRKKNRALFGREDSKTNFMRFSTSDGIVKGESPRTYKLSPFEQRVGGICEVCNSGWLNKIDLDFEALQFRLVNKLSVMGGASDARLIYTWAYKTALVWTLTDRSCEGATSSHHIKNLYNTKHPDLNVGVWIFNGNEPIDIFAKHNFGAIAIGSQRIEYNQVTIAMGSMGIYVIMFSPDNRLLNPRIVEDEILKNTGNNAKRMWPESVNFIWPLSVDKISEEDILNVSISLSRAQNAVSTAELLAGNIYMSSLKGSDGK